MLFGTDGIRGIANVDLSPEMAFRVGRATAAVLWKAGGRPQLAVGRDTRLSGDLLQSALMAGLLSAGADVLDLEVMTTPGVAYLAHRLGCTGGAVISASHNPAEYNGIKLFTGEGFKFPDQIEAEIEDMALGSDAAPRPGGREVGKREDARSARSLYLDYLLASIPGSLPGTEVVVDCAHGATSDLAPELLRRAGAKVTAINARPDGLNINDGCGSTAPDMLRRAVLELAAEKGAGWPPVVGMAHDGDGDRTIAVDEAGQVVDGDAILGILGVYWQAVGRLPSGGVVATVMSNLGLELFLRQHGITLMRTPVGDRNVLEAMRAAGHNLGGEQSGHVILLDYATTGDGMLTALQLLWTQAEKGLPLSRLAAGIPRLPQVLRNLRLENGCRYQATPRIAAAVEEARALLGEGRVLVRPSGTEPLVRIMVEGVQSERVEQAVVLLEEVISEELKASVLPG